MQITQEFCLRKILIILVLFICCVFGSGFSMKEVDLTLLEVDNGYGIIADSDDITIGSSGVVIHSFDSHNESIIARASVVEKNGSTAKIRLELFSMLEQNALPLPGVLPEAGDHVKLNFLYSRSLIVAPNKEIYDEVTNSFTRLTFIHPDIVASYLNYEFKPNPSRDDFRKMCNKNLAGLIFFALENESVFVDCGSFKVIKRFNSGHIGYYNLPFYSRVGKIDTVFWDFSSAQINNYDAYYRSLLKE